MRTIERSSAFKRDLNRRRPHRATAMVWIRYDQVLPSKNRDHGLSGEWAGYRECHIKPDLLLIYSKPGTGTLRLARLGSHSELFG
jgi:mRNA interferase YafQ